jgi:hypothetical protein
MPRMGDQIVVTAVDRDGQEQAVLLKVMRMDGLRVDIIRAHIVTNSGEENG